MSLFVPPRKFDPNNPEFVDSPVQDAALFEHALSQLEHINRWSGGYHAAVDAIASFARNHPKHLDLTVLDFCCGTADVMRKVIQKVRSERNRVFVTALDAHEVTVEYARRRNADCREMQIEHLDVTTQGFPYAPMSFDVTTCTLALHHFDSPSALLLLARMWRTCRKGMVVSDLRRNRLIIWAATLFAPLVLRNPLCSHDAKISVQAAFSMGELAQMAKRTGITHFVIKRRFPFRMTLVATKQR